MTQLTAHRCARGKSRSGRYFLRLLSRTRNAIFLVALFASALTSLEATDYIPNANLSLSGSVTVVETDERLAFNADPDGGTPATAGLTNHALAANGGAAFESSRISTTYGDDKLNNGVYGESAPDIDDATRPWISLLSDSNGWGGVKFSGPITLSRFAFGSRFENRSDGTFTMQYTTDSFVGVDLETPAQVDGLTWTTFGTLTSTSPTEFGRHLFALTSPVAGVTGVRVVASQGGSTVTEVEAYETLSSLNATYTTGTDVPLTTPGFDGTGSTVSFTLNYAPTPGTTLTVVDNTGPDFIQGEFDNLTNGEVVNLSYGGITYAFVAWYYGGDGNDLVLVPRYTGLAAWGDNIAGQLGDNSTLDSPVPVLVDQGGALNGKTVVSVTAGTIHSLALCSDGTLAAWGRNDDGQLGNNSTTSSSVPVLVNQSGVLNGKTVVSIAAGDLHTLALCSDGTLAAWGYNGDGQLGNNSTTSSSVPVLVDQSGVLNGKTVVSIAAGYLHTLALCSDGTLAAWGYNLFGQLGNNSTMDSSVPVLVDQGGILSGKTVIAIAAGGEHALALCSDGTLAAWGNNFFGQLGDNSIMDSSVPVLVEQGGLLNGKTVVSIAAGGLHTLALCSDGTLAAWGYNLFGQLGDNSTTDSLVPVLVDRSGVLNGKTVVSIVAGLYHSLALCSDGTLAAWGRNESGELGDNSTTSSSVPLLIDQGGVLNGKTIVSTAAGNDHSLALFEATPEIAVEQPVSTDLTDGSATIDFGTTALVGSAVERTFTIRNTGTWPLTNFAIPIDGTDAGDFSVTASPAAEVAPGASTTFTVRFLPVSTGAKTAALHLASNDADENPFDINLTGTGGAATTLPATYTTGTEVPLTTPGFDGTGSTVNFTLNYAPTPGTTLTVVDNTGPDFIGGEFSNLANGAPVDLTYSGITYAFVAWYYGGDGNDLVLVPRYTGLAAWGLNLFGQLGDNSIMDSSVPVLVEQGGVLNGKTVVSVAAGDSHSLVLCSDGTLAAWGRNLEGQLGNNSTTSSPVPVLVDRSGVLAGKTVVSITAGVNHSLALCSDGTLAAWGWNDDGQLGNNSTTSSPVPVLVDQSGVLNGKTVVSVAAGDSYSLVLCSDGTLAAWGYNNEGQLGNNSTTWSGVPVLVDRSGVLNGKTVVSVAAGLSHNFALCSDGTLAAWGSNSYGRLGNNSTTSSPVPVLVDRSGVLSGKTVVSVAAGDRHSLALCSDGTLAAWGWNFYGQLGNNSTMDSSVPVLVEQGGVLNGKTVVSIAAGTYHNFALCSDGTLAAWGWNILGQLGNNSTMDSSVPVLVDQGGVLNGKTIVSTAAARWHSLAKFMATPEIAVEQPVATDLTDGSATIDFDSAEEKTFTIRNTGGAPLTGFAITIDGPNAGDFSVTASPAAEVAPGASTTFTVRFVPSSVGARTATLHLASNDADENPFDITLTGTTAPEISVEQPAATDLTDGSATIDFGTTVLVGSAVERTFTIRNTGTWPLTNFAITIDGTDAGDFSLTANPATGVASGASTSFTVRFFPGSTGAKTAALHLASNDADENPFDINLTGTGGAGTTLPATYTTGTEVPLSTPGFDGTGSTVNFTLNYAPAPGTELTVVDNTGPDFIGGEFDNLANGAHVDLTYSGITYAFVAWYYGGDGNDLVLVPRYTGLAAWGSNFFGQLGDNSIMDSSVPVLVEQGGVLNGKTVVSIAAGASHTLALCSDGTLAAWGYNILGQLGNNSTMDSSVPVLVDEGGVLNGKTVVSVVAGVYHSLALCSDGTLAAWGDNFRGQLGNNSTTGSPVPVLVDQGGVLNGKTVVSVVAGLYHSLALCSDGTLAAWGDNGFGRLGNNSNNDSPVPVLVDRSGVLNGKTVVSVVAGVYHSLALCSDGTLAAWGRNDKGQLGNNSTTTSPVPVLVEQGGVLNGKTVVSVAAGEDHSLALCSDGTLAAWGRNADGQLGNNSIMDSSVPVLVDQGGVLNGKTVVSVVAGRYHNFALCSDGTLAAWGGNSSGQLGNNSTTDSNVPVLVDQGGVLNGKTIVSTAAARNHSLAKFMATPEIAVEQPVGTDLTDGSATIDFDSAEEKTFTIRNTGGAPLTGFAITIDGPNAGDFSVTASPAAEVAPGASTTFTVRFVPSSVGARTAALHLASNDADENPFDITLTGTTAPEISVEQPAATDLTDGSATIDFGTTVPVGSPVDKTFTIRNTGDWPLTDLGIVIDGTDAGAFSVTASPATEVAPGASTTFTVRFVPSSVGAKTAALHLASNDADENPFDIALTGTGGLPEISVEQPVGNGLTDGSATVDFGTPTLVGSSVEKTFTIRNTGGADLTNLAITVDGTDAGDFSVTSAPVSAIPAGGSTRFSVRFAPTTTGTKNATLRLASNDADENPFDINLTGMGSSGNTLSATFHSGTDVPLTTAGLSASGKLVNLGLNFTPTTGVNLTVVNNTGPDFIQGAFDNLANGEVVNLSFGGSHFPFVAWYYGGDGNDLVLLWRDVTLAGWGQNSSGQLGDGTTTYSSVPVPVDPGGVLAGKTIVSTAAARYHSLALCTDGSLAAWGRNGDGQLGDGTTTGSGVPVLVDRSGVLAGKTVVAIAAGDGHSLALCSDGTLAAWGGNSSGQLGNNSNTDSNVPVLVDQGGVLNGKTVVSIAAGASHTLALCSDGTLAAWGYNILGQLGNNFTTDSSVPVLVDRNGVLNGKTVVSIAAGTFHNLVLCSDGTLASWGGNIRGELGDGTNIDSGVPVLVDQSGVLAGKTVVSISAGHSLSIVRCSDGSLVEWRGTPTAIDQSGVLAGKEVIDISVGRLNAALCSDGTLATLPHTGPELVDQSGMLAANPGQALLLPRSGGGEHVLAVYAHLSADITVEQPVSNVLTNGSDTVDFGEVNLFGGSPMDRTFTIRNDGFDDLMTSSPTITGTHARAFSVTSNPAASVPPSGSTTFTVRFTPTRQGTNNATLSIASNDPDENPFTISLAGTATGVFTWDPVAGAEWYNFYIQKDGALHSTFWSEAVGEVSNGMLTPATTYPAGTYTWYVRSWSAAGGYTDWIQQPDFSYARTELISPDGTISETRPLFEWTRSDHARQGATYPGYYNLYIQRNGALWKSVWLEGGDTTTWQQPLADGAMPPGNYAFYVAPWNEADGVGPYSGPMEFDLGVPDLIGPMSPVTEGDWTPEISWTESPSADYYQLYIQRNGALFKSIWKEGSTTTMHQETEDMPAGTYSVWLNPWSLSGGYGPWVGPMEFTIGLPVPLTPTGLQTAGVTQPVFTWTGSAKNEWYNIYVAGSGVINIWIPSNQVVNESWDPSVANPAAFPANLTPLLSPGEHQWWIRGYSAADGIGSWIEGPTFTIQEPD